LIEHGPHWINIIIFTFISEKNKSTGVYRICNKIISFDMKKMGNLKQVIGKVKKTMNLKVLRMNLYVSKVIPQSCLNSHIIKIKCAYIPHAWVSKKINDEQNHEDSFTEWNIYNHVPSQENVKMPTIQNHHV
jgi:hypothetical protein